MTMTPERIAELRRMTEHSRDFTLRLGAAVTAKEFLGILDLASTALTAREDALREAAATVLRLWPEADELSDAILALIGERHE